MFNGSSSPARAPVLCLEPLYLFILLTLCRYKPWLNQPTINAFYFLHDLVELLTVYVLMRVFSNNQLYSMHRSIQGFLIVVFVRVFFDKIVSLHVVSSLSSLVQTCTPTQILSCCSSWVTPWRIIIVWHHSQETRPFHNDINK